MGNSCSPRHEGKETKLSEDISVQPKNESKDEKVDDEKELIRVGETGPPQSTPHLLRVSTQVVRDRVKKNGEKHSEYKRVRDKCRTGLSEDERVVVYQKCSKAMGSSKSLYEELRKELMRGMKIEDFPAIPKFGDESSHDIDSPEKQRAGKRVLLLLSNEHPAVSYCPIIPNLVELFLWQVEEDETFSLVNGMIEISYTTDWYFKTDAVGFKKSVEGFLVLAREFAPKIYRKQEQYVTCIAELWFKTFFEGYFSNEQRAKLMDPFLFEGCKILYKIGLSILRFCEVKGVTTAINLRNFENEVKTICEKEVDEILRKAWPIKIKKSVLRKYNEKFDPNTGLVSIPRISYMIRSWPNFEDGDSDIITKKQFYSAWASLPHEIHECSVTRVYSSDKDGCNLIKLRSICRLKSHLLFFVQTVANEKFGCYVRSINNCEKIPKDEADLRIFSITPAVRAWKVTEFKESKETTGFTETKGAQSAGLVFCNNKEFYVGDWSSKALWLNGTMEDGYTQKCRSLKSPVLVNNESGMFKILRLEAFMLSLFTIF